MSEITEPTKTKNGKVVPRSPAYPYVNLRVAIDRARAIYEHENRNPAPLDVIVRHWGFSPKSSGGRSTIGALSSFGLVESVGSNYKLTERAWRILLDAQESPERRVAIQQAALAPAIHEKLWNKYRNSLPSDANLRRSLIFDEKFYEKAVDGFISEYKEIRSNTLDCSTLVHCLPEIQILERMMLS